MIALALATAINFSPAPPPTSMCALKVDLNKAATNLDARVVDKGEFLMIFIPGGFMTIWDNDGSVYYLRSDKRS